MINKNSNLKDYSLSLNKDFTLKAKSIEEGEIIATNDEIEQEKNGKIFEMNKNNLNDLDDLYFFDKIKMGPKRSNSEIKIPILNITKKNKNYKKREEAPVGKVNIKLKLLIFLILNLLLIILINSSRLLKKMNSNYILIDIYAIFPIKKYIYIHCKSK